MSNAAAQGRKLVNKLAEDSEKSRAGVAMGKPSQGPGGAVNYAFPTSLSGANSRDELVKLKMQLMEQGGQSPFGEIQMTDQDIKWLQDKQALAEEANFQQWFAEQFNLADPATRAWAQRVNPKFYSDRERMLLEKVRLATRIKLIELRGPKNQEDMMVLYGLRTGKLKLDKGWDKVGLSYGVGEVDSATQQSKFKEGLMAPEKYPANSQRTAAAGASWNPFNQGAPNPSTQQFANATTQGSQWSEFINQYIGTV